MLPSYSQNNVTICQKGSSEEDALNIAAEVPVSLVYKGISHVVMMASPQDLEDFGLGFSLSEGIIERPEDLKFIDVAKNEQGYLIDMDIQDKAYQAIANRRRYLSGRTGCGLCGVESLDEAVPDLKAIAADIRLRPQSVYKAFEDLHPLQPVKQATGAVHGAAWCSDQGDVLYLREDVGRHNALDKLIGAVIKEGENLSQGFCLITSRCSYEMVQKAVQMNIPVLAAISSPTTLAVDMAQSYDLTLLARVREKTFTIFTHGHRMVL